MTVYDAGNPGAYPINATSLVGQARYTFGDTISTAYDPVEPGFQNFVYFSDQEWTAFLASSTSSVPGAVGFAYLQLAGQAALESKNVKTDDLSIDMSKRAADLRAQADFWFARDAMLTGDYFDIVGASCVTTPEFAESSLCVCGDGTWCSC